MSDAASRYMKQAAAQLAALDGTLSRASAGAGDFTVEAEAIQASVREAARQANTLAQRMKDDSD